MSANDLFLEMLNSIKMSGRQRTVTDPTSPMQTTTVESAPNRSFTHYGTNVVSVRKVDLRWALANVLHFFAATEEAEALRPYNRFADRFIVKGRLTGAYGAMAHDQLRACSNLLLAYPDTRRAIMYMGGEFTYKSTNINIPSCWSTLHFLVVDGKLDMIVNQRSLNVLGVMPYDLILLTNIHYWMSANTDIQSGKLWWTIGCLHVKMEETIKFEPAMWSNPSPPLYVDASVLNDPERCYGGLVDPAILPDPYRFILEARP